MDAALRRKPPLTAPRHRTARMQREKLYEEGSMYLRRIRNEKNLRIIVRMLKIVSENLEMQRVR